MLILTIYPTRKRRKVKFTTFFQYKNDAWKWKRRFFLFKNIRNIYKILKIMQEYLWFSNLYLKFANQRGRSETKILSTQGRCCESRGRLKKSCVGQGTPSEPLRWNVITMPARLVPVSQTSFCTVVHEFA